MNNHCSIGAQVGGVVVVVVGGGGCKEKEINEQSLLNRDFAAAALHSCFNICLNCYIVEKKSRHVK